MSSTGGGGEGAGGAGFLAGAAGFFLAEGAELPAGGFFFVAGAAVAAVAAASATRAHGAAHTAANAAATMMARDSGASMGGDSTRTHAPPHHLMHGLKVIVCIHLALTYHVVPGRLTAADITICDVMQSNGVIHSVDRVLMPR
jgi:hypothetical protein